MEEIMINFNNFRTLNWQFELFGYGHSDETGHQCFNFKSPRMRDFRHYNTIIQSNADEGLIEYERECYLNQLMMGINNQLSAVESDIKRQLNIHIQRNLPIPPELKVDATLKIV